MGDSARCGFSPEARKQDVVGRSLWGLQAEAADPFLGCRGTALVPGSLPLSAVGGTRERERTALAGTSVWGTGGERRWERAGSLSTVRAVSFFLALTK